jgi:hypothetical protein
MFATIALTSYYDLPDLKSFSTLIDHHIQMHKYPTNCTSRTNSFDLAGIPCLVFEPKPFNTFEGVDAILAATFQEEPLEAYFGQTQIEKAAE